MEQINVSADSAGIAGETDTKVTGGPQGIGMAVAFDWGLAVQFVAMPFVQSILGSLGILKETPIQVVSVIVSLVFASVFATLGQGLRSGWRWVRIVQIVLNSLGFLAGIASLLTVIPSIQHGRYLSLIPTFILFVISPLIVWRLSRPVTGAWFKTVTSAEARKRHGGVWPWLILLWSLVGGILVALSASLGSR